MNKEKFEKRVVKRYGVSSEVLKDLSVSKIKNLKINHKYELKEKEKFKLVKKPIKVIAKGAGLGASVAGCVNTLFPNLIPVIGTYITTSSNISSKAKLALLTSLASLPIDLASGYGVIAVGAGLGALTYSGYKLVKIATNHLKIVNDRGKAKKLNRI